jgi:lipoprotein-anchoring transpeptidase ErfK/SrfK
MSWYVGFVDSRGIGIHDSQPVPGRPASHGCVRLGNTKADDDFARKINKNVVPGSTVVHVHDKAPTTPWTKGAPAKSRPPKKR